MKLPTTKEQALSKLAGTCSRREQTESDLREKLNLWKIDEEGQDFVIERLRAGNYINEERYAHAFVHDKFHFEGWGPVKISYILWQKKIPKDCVNKALEQISQEQWEDKLLELMRRKAESLTNRTRREKKAAMMRFANSRGYEWEMSDAITDRILNEDDHA